MKSSAIAVSSFREVHSIQHYTNGQGFRYYGTPSRFSIYRLEKLINSGKYKVITQLRSFDGNIAPMLIITRGV